MRPGNYEIFRDSLAAHGLLGKDKDLAWASGRFQLECYKEEIEASLRTPGLGGFQLLDLHDYVGQGTALVGLLDTFWQSKGYVTPPEFREFCNTTVPLARLKSRVFTTADTLDVPVEVAHYGEKSLANAHPYWQNVGDGGRVVAQGQWPVRTIPLGTGITLGRVTIRLAGLTPTQSYTLVVGLHGTPFKNRWRFWLYPAAVNTPAPSDVLVTHSWAQAEARLASAGKVLFLPTPTQLDLTSPPLDSVPVFWNRQMGPGWSRMLGLWCDAKHPALASFPTQANYDWQWADLVAPPVRGLPRARAVNLDRLPQALQPIVQPIDDWNRNYKLGLVFECRVGPGRLLVCSPDIETALDSRPAARQLRRSLLEYMAGPKFAPPVAVTPADLRGLWFDTRIMTKLGATAQADGQPADMLIDGDPTRSG